MKMKNKMTEEQIDVHVNEMIAGTIRGTKDPKEYVHTVRMLDKVYRPFCKLAYDIGDQAWDGKIPMPKLFDAVVDLTILQIYHTSGYVTGREQLDLKIRFINSFFVHMAERMGELLEEAYPGEGVAKIDIKDIIKKLGETTH
jgi:hypothetical protein